MKPLLIFFLLLIMPIVSFAQYDQVLIDSLQTELKNAANDTIRLEFNRQLGFYFQDSEPGIALIYHQEQLELAKKLNLKLWEADAYQQIGYCYRWLDNLPASYESYMKGLKIAEDPSNSDNGWGYNKFSFSESPDDARQSIVGMIHYELASLYNRSRSYDEVRSHLFQALSIGEKLKNKKILSLATRDIGRFYFDRDQLDSAFKYYKIALGHYEDSPYQINTGIIHFYLSEYYAEEQKFDSAIVSAKSAMSLTVAETNLGPLAEIELFLGRIFLQTSQLDSALTYTEKALETSQLINDKLREGLASVQLASIYRLQDQNGPAYEYMSRGQTLLDSINDAYITRLLQFQNLEFDQKIRLTELEKESELTKNRIRVYSLLAGLLVFLLIGLILYRGNRRKQKANQLLAKQKEEIQTALNLLKSTQSQLIQSEKMASLGELTAGIAHEIQNPLNFVNNFSEVSVELVEEIRDSRLKTQDLPTGQAGSSHKMEADEIEDEILEDIKQNLEKINHHGKRADAIVKGMLAHSRNSTGEKVLTDINALADEYLRLSYHGLRAKDKNFNADFSTNFDSELPKINVIPQDIGRVLLNLINNAFQACTEPSRSAAAEVEKPLVQVSTRKSDNGIEISVSDNGSGIPDDIKDKIFQPFFTTKPTGQGTGLGLSLSYDIVKAHGGELKVETKEGSGLPAGEAGTEFTILLPI